MPTTLTRMGEFTTLSYDFLGSITDADFLGSISEGDFLGHETEGAWRPGVALIDSVVEALGEVRRRFVTEGQLGDI